MITPLSLSDVMHEGVETVGPDEPAAVAARRLRAADVGSLVVVDAGEPVGIVTESDVVGLVADGVDPESTPVSALMSGPLVTASPDTPLHEAAERMRDERIKKLPVVADGDLVGIVTTTDVSNYFPRLARETRARGGPPEAVAPGGPDTAYEDENWEFESEGLDRTDPASIELGDTVRFSKELSDDDIHAFADASGDTNRLHLDDEFAAGSRFGRRIAHGTLVVGTVSAALARLPGLVVYLSQDVSYLGPVDIGDRVVAECTVTEELGRNRFRLTTVVDTAEGERVIDGEAVVMADSLPEGA
jgi:CBS domain-containing protein/acyl dehydratase